MKNIILIVLDSVRRDFFFNKIKNTLDELKNNFVDFTNCYSIYTATFISHYTIFFGDYFNKAINQNFPAQLKNLGFKTRSFCNGAIINGYPLKHIVEPNIKNYRPFRDEMINDLGMVPESNWNKKLYGETLEDYYGAADDEDRNIPNKWKEYINNNKDENNFIFLHFWNAHFIYGINNYLKNKIEGKNYIEIGKKLLKRVMNKELTEKFVKKAYSMRIYELINIYVRELISLLKQNKMYDDSMIIITSDHGEGLGDIGRYLTKKLFFIYKKYNVIQHFIKFLPDIKSRFSCKWDFYAFYHHGRFELQKEIPLLIKFPNNEFGGKKYHRKVTLFDLIHTINDLIGKKINIKSKNGFSLYSLLKKGDSAREQYKIKENIKKLITIKKI